MDWARHPSLYQLTHWWHWLAYGQNVAVLGFLGLAAYVWYTRRMMKLQEETRRLSLTPHLVASYDTRPNGDLLHIVNGGAAAAVSCYSFALATDEVWVHTGLVVGAPDGMPRIFHSALQSGKEIVIPIANLPNTLKLLFVMDYHDVIDNEYQLQVFIGREGREITFKSGNVKPNISNTLSQNIALWLRLRLRLKKVRAKHGFRKLP